MDECTRAISRQKQTSIVKMLTEARDTLDSMIEKVQEGDEESLQDAANLSGNLSSQVNTIDRRMEQIP